MTFNDNYQTEEYKQDLRDTLMSPTCTVYFKRIEGRRDSERDYVSVLVVDNFKNGERAQLIDVTWRIAQTFPYFFKLGRRDTAHQHHIIRGGAQYHKAHDVADTLARELLDTRDIPAHWEYN